MMWIFPIGVIIYIMTYFATQEKCSNSLAEPEFGYIMAYTILTIFLIVCFLGTIWLIITSICSYARPHLIEFVRECIR